MKCEHDSYTPTGKEINKCLSSETYVYQEQKCDECNHIFYEEYLYLGTKELNEVQEE